MKAANLMMLMKLLEELDKETASTEHYSKKAKEDLKKDGINSAMYDMTIERAMLLRGHIADLIDDLDDLEVRP